MEDITLDKARQNIAYHLCECNECTKFKYIEKNKTMNTKEKGNLEMYLKGHKVADT